jgi:hypothetical protein
MKRRLARIPANKLTLVAFADSFHDPREPPLFLGNWVRLNSGGPRALVVDEGINAVTVAWRSDDGAHEADFPRPCLHRIE